MSALKKAYAAGAGLEVFTDNLNFLFFILIPLKLATAVIHCECCEKSLHQWMSAKKRALQTLNGHFPALDS